MEKILIVGSSGHAKVIIEIVELEARYQIAGLIDSYRNVGEQTLGYPILGDLAELETIAKQHNCTGVIVGIGDNFFRGKIGTEIKTACQMLRLVNATHPSASISKRAIIGDGTVIMAGVSVGPCCTVGELCILNTNSSLDHDSIMKNCASMAPNAVTGGNCTIGEYTAIGIGASLTHSTHVGGHTLIGAGATVLNDIDSLVVAYGTPARPVRKRTIGEKYL